MSGCAYLICLSFAVLNAPDGWSWTVLWAGLAALIAVDAIEDAAKGRKRG